MLVSIKENQTLPKHLKQGIGRVLITGVKNKDKIMEKKEFKVGDIIHPLGTDITLEVVEQENCKGCYYKGKNCHPVPYGCYPSCRKDHKSVIFKQIDKDLMSEETAQKLNIGFNNIKNDMENDMKGKQVKRLNIIPPEGYEMNVDKHGIVTFKKEEEEPKIRTWNDLEERKHKVKGYFIDDCDSEISFDEDAFSVDGDDKCNFIDEKHAKSALAMAMISQLMPYYGGAITDEEWNDDKIYKYVIMKINNAITKNDWINTYFFLAFHTAEQRDSFLKYNGQLVKDYLMIE